MHHDIWTEDNDSGTDDDPDLNPDDNMPPTPNGFCSISVTPKIGMGVSSRGSLKMKGHTQGM